MTSSWRRLRENDRLTSATDMNRLANSESEIGSGGAMAEESRKRRRWKPEGRGLEEKAEREKKR